MKKIILAALCGCMGLKAMSQVGPSLTGGAEGLVAKQGQLDAQLILDIIATKKGEIKSELGQRLILKKLEGGPYVLYDYTEQTLKLLFNQQDKNVITKELMKNSAELLIVYGMAEYLLQDLQRKEKYTKVERDLIDLFINQTGYENTDSIEHIFYPKITGEQLKKFLVDSTNLIKEKGRQEYKNRIAIYTQAIGSPANQETKKQAINIQSDQRHSIKLNEPSMKLETLAFPSHYLLKPTLTQFLSNNSPNYRESKNKYYSPMTMFADMIYDACINNKSVTSTGLFQSTNSSQERYRAMSKFLFFEDRNDSIFIPLNNYKAHVDSILTYLFSYYNLLEELGEAYETTSNAELVSGFETDTLHIKDVEKLLRLLKKKFSYAKGGSPVSLLETAYSDELEISKRIAGLPIILPVAKKKSDNASTAKDKADSTSIAKRYLDIVYTLKKEILPKLATLNTINNGAYDTAVDLCQRIKVNLFSNALQIFKKDSAAMHGLIKSTENYLPLLNVINNLNRVESYDYIFKFLTGIAETIGDKKTKTVVKVLTTGVDNFTTIDKEKNEIRLDVEGLAVSAFERFSKNQHSRVSLLFSVGASHNVSTGKNSQFITNESKDTLGYSQFIAEKIGVRFNLFDWNRSRSFSRNNYLCNKGEMRRASRLGVDPIVNNFHALLYTSGLLYKIQALNSAGQFTKPIVGAGLGITFFNGLDFNFSYAMPYSLNTKQGFMSISFDIAITEYLTLARSKKKG